MSSKILITGGTGLVGKHLTKLLQEDGYSVSWLSRKKSTTSEVPTFQWDLESKFIEPEALEVDHIIHLAGAGVADQRWTDSRKKLIYDSRIQSTQLLFEKVKEHDVSLKSFITASAIGGYGLDTGEKLMDEDSPFAKDFLAKVVEDWESTADEFLQLDTPVIKLRIGIVLDTDEGALPKISKPIKLGAGAPLGTGDQYMSWVHVHDLARIFQWSLSQTSSQVYNAVAPHPVDNRHMTKAIAKVLRKPLLLPPVPGFVLKLMLGEMSGIVLGGNNVSSKKLVQAGFNFEFQDLTEALQNLLK